MENHGQYIKKINTMSLNFFQITNSIFGRGYFETQMLVIGIFCGLLHIAAGILGLFYLDTPFTCR